MFPQLRDQLVAAATAMADAPLPEFDSSRSSRRRRLSIALVAASCGAVAISLTLPGGPSDNEALAARVYAALGEKGFIHFVLETRAVRDGKVRYTQRVERWQLDERVRTDTIMRSPGATQRSQVATDGRTAVFYDVTNRIVSRNAIDPSHKSGASDPFSVYRERYRSGAVHDLGSAEYRGQQVRRLQVRTAMRVLTYLVSDKSALPVAIKVTENPRFVIIRGSHRKPVRGAAKLVRVSRVVSYERLADTTETRALLTIHPPAGVRRLPYVGLRP